MDTKAARILLYSFDNLTVDCASGQVRKSGELRIISPRAFEVLVYLLEHPGRIIEKQELFDQVWKGTFVSDNALTRSISEVRRVIGDSAEEPRYIETAMKRGYRFMANVTVSNGSTVLSTVPQGSYQAETSELRPEQAAQTGSESLPQSTAPLPSDSFGETTRPGGPLRSPQRELLWLALALVAALVVSLTFWNPFHHLPGAPAPHESATAAVRTVPFTSLHGQEKWPAFSPDGNEIAFAWEGEQRDNFDIYVKLIGTGEPLRLTQHPGLDACPSWSPDGRTIAFVRAYQGQVTLLSVPALGGAERTLIPLNFKGDWYGQYPTISWSPDGKLIAFPDKNPERMVTSIHLLSVESLEKRQLTAPPQGYSGDLCLAFSPDGKNIAFTRYGSEGAADVYVVSISGGEPRRLTFDQRQVPGLAWMPDGKSIVFSSTRGGSVRMWRIALTGGTPELLSFGGDNPVPGTLRPFAVSRLGRRLAYVKSFEDKNIWRFEIPGGKRPAGRPVKLIASTQQETAPQFSPDGKKITFESHRSGEYEIWVCNADGSNPLQLTSFGGPMVGTPRWSPDGTRIAFDARLKGNADIVTVPASGGASRRVTEDPSNEVVPSWSNDGRWIYFTSNRGKDLQIWKVPAGGGKARQVTRNGGFAAFESSDGQFLYYSKMTDSGIWRMPVNGGEETLIADVVAPGRWGYWALAPEGIYFVDLDLPRNHTIDFFDFSTRKTRTIASLTEQFNTEAADSTLAVSPDGRWILYAQLDEAESDIMLVENFR